MRFAIARRLDRPLRTPAFDTFRPVVLPAVLILTALALLLTLAYASPPDPSWIPGVYDDADYDDVVTLVMSVTGNVVSAIPVDSGTTPACVASVPPFTEDVTVARSRFASPPRAPPVP